MAKAKITKQEETINSIVLNNLIPSKSNCVVLSKRIASLVQGGHISAIDAAIRLSAMEELIKLAKADIKLDILFELNNYKGGASINGTTVSVTETGVKYDYSVNPLWVELNEVAEAAIEKRKEIEEAIKRILPGKIMVDEQTGETLCGAPKTSTTSPIVRLAK